ncbi:MAG: hypothetical protein AAF266_06440 [Planctomycetota bacterium]
MIRFAQLSIVTALLLAGSSVEAQTLAPTRGPGVVANVRESEAAVRAMPIEQRPNRIGHFYGNTVRRRHHGTLFVNRQHTDRPVARFFYIAR